MFLCYNGSPCWWNLCSGKRQPLILWSFSGLFVLANESKNLSNKINKSFDSDYITQIPHFYVDGDALENAKPAVPEQKADLKPVQMSVTHIAPPAQLVFFMAVLSRRCSVAKCGGSHFPGNFSLMGSDVRFTWSTNLYVLLLGWFDIMK